MSALDVTYGQPLFFATNFFAVMKFKKKMSAPSFKFQFFMIVTEDSVFVRIKNVVDRPFLFESLIMSPQSGNFKFHQKNFFLTPMEFSRTLEVSISTLRYGICKKTANPLKAYFLSM